MLPIIMERVNCFLWFKQVYVTNQHMNVDNIHVSYVTIYQHISVASSAIIGVSFKNSNSIPAVARNV